MKYFETYILFLHPGYKNHKIHIPEFYAVIADDYLGINNFQRRNYDFADSL